MSLEHKCHGYFLEIIIIKTIREHTSMRLMNSSATYLFVASSWRLGSSLSVQVYTEDTTNDYLFFTRLVAVSLLEHLHTAKGMCGCFSLAMAIIQIKYVDRNIASVCVSYSGCLLLCYPYKF